MPYENSQREAFGVLTSGRMARALAIEDEPDAVRDRYGRHQFGQTMLMARRLIEAGVRIVQANVSYQALWDTHTNNFVGLRSLLAASRPRRCRRCWTICRPADCWTRRW